jgi:hypothetical protein
MDEEHRLHYRNLEATYKDDERVLDSPSKKVKNLVDPDKSG